MKFTININPAGADPEKTVEIVARITGALKGALEATGVEISETRDGANEVTLSGRLPGAEEAEAREWMVAEVVRQIRERGLNEGDLDGTIHDYKGGEAADINNGGFEAQARYLLEANDWRLEVALAEISQIETED